MKIANFPVLDFSGGVRRDKSFFDFKRNELLDARNVEIDEQGRIRTRRGSFQVGQTLTGNIENSFLFQRSKYLKELLFLISSYNNMKNNKMKIHQNIKFFFKNKMKNDNYVELL